MDKTEVYGLVMIYSVFMYISCLEQNPNTHWNIVKPFWTYCLHGFVLQTLYLVKTGNTVAGTN